MKFKLRLLLFILFLGLFVTTAKATYARYATTATGKTNLNMAKWQISINNQNITENYNSELTFTPTIINNEHTKKGTIAPGTKGYFDIEVNPEKVDVSFSYNIALDLPENSPVKDLIISEYAIIEKDQAENEINKVPYTNSAITNTLKYNNQTPDFKFNPFTIRIYFEWYDEDDNLMNDIEDTKASQKANSDDTDFNIHANISFKQYNG